MFYFFFKIIFKEVIHYINHNFNYLKEFDKLYLINLLYFVEYQFQIKIF